jgi:NMD protein affecting ribosome stability and mRNA decay
MSEEKKIACVFCGLMVISKHFKTYMCDECYKNHKSESVIDNKEWGP